MHAQAVQQTKDRFSTLRRAMQSNGAFSGVSGLVLALGGKSVAAFIGLDSPAVLTGLGIVLILFAVDLFWAASRPEIARWMGWTAVILDVVWVVGSYAIILIGWPSLSVAGKWTVALLAEAVGVFAIWQAIGLRRAR